MSQHLYFDNNASTPVDPRVVEEVLRILTQVHGNPSSTHWYGQQAMKELGDARQKIASYFGVKPTEVIFTSGATESLNMIIKGFFEKSSGGHAITTNVEHPAVFRSMQWAQKKGIDVSYLNVGRYGAATPEMVKDAIKPNTRLIVIMGANNETGVLTDIDGIAAVAQEAGIPFIVDGVALLGKHAFKLHPGISAICFSGHKIHAPKGVGVTILRKKLILEPFIVGGEHEFGHRAGTQNLPGIVAVAKAIEILSHELPAIIAHMTKLRDCLEKGLRAILPDVKINGEGPRVANTSNLQFPGVDGEALLALLDREGVAVSHGSACSSGALQPSRILTNMGLTQEEASASVRLSVSRMTTEEEVDRVIAIVANLVRKLK